MVYMYMCTLGGLVLSHIHSHMNSMCIYILYLYSYRYTTSRFSRLYVYSDGVELTIRGRSLFTHGAA